MVTRSGTYAYRADGMRVAKSIPGLTARYRHDGQMGIEDVEVQGSTTTVTRYGLGARGMDMLERTVGSTVTTGFPIYDAHGNMVATLSRSGMGYAVNDRRSYDAWGVVRSQQSAGDPKLRYCASLGHKQDDESGLIYMRARYYEPTSGRFISEDPAAQGLNWFAYCRNNPVGCTDSSGMAVDPAIGMADEMEIEADKAVIAMGSGAMNALLNAVARYTLQQVAAIASAGAAIGQTFVTEVGKFNLEYVVGKDTDMGAFAILTKVKDSAGSTVFFGIFSGNNAGIYNLHIKMIDAEHWMDLFNGQY